MFVRVCVCVFVTSLGTVMCTHVVVERERERNRGRERGREKQREREL